MMPDKSPTLSHSPTQLKNLPTIGANDYHQYKKILFSNYIFCEHNENSVETETTHQPNIYFYPIDFIYIFH